MILVGKTKPTPLDAGRTDVAARHELTSIGEIDHDAPVAEFRIDAFAHLQNLCAELDSLLACPLGERGPTDYIWESHIIFDK